MRNILLAGFALLVLSLAAPGLAAQCGGGGCGGGGCTSSGNEAVVEKSRERKAAALKAVRAMAKAECTGEECGEECNDCGPACGGCDTEAKVEAKAEEEGCCPTPAAKRSPGAVQRCRTSKAAAMAAIRASARKVVS